jgi:hypothetical protein
MQLQMTNKAFGSILSLVVLGSAVAGIDVLIAQQPTLAQYPRTPETPCLPVPINTDFSESQLACYSQINHDDDDYYGRNRHNYRDHYRGGRSIELRARSGPTPEGRWRYTAPNVPYDAMQRAGCQNVSGDDWRCPTPRIRVEVLRNQERFLELRARSGPTPEGRWRYTAEGVPPDAMQRAGCQNVSGADWRCPTSRIRVQITERY